MKLLKRFPVVATPSHLAYSPDSSTVFVSLQDSDKLAAFDLRTMTEKWIVPIGKTPAGVLWLNGRVLVADMGTDYLAAADPATGKVVAAYRDRQGGAPVVLVAGWQNPVGQQPRRRHHRLARQHHAEADPRYNIPGGPDDLAFAPNGKIWITRRWAEKVAVLDPATGAYETIDVGRSPHGLFLNPNAPSPTVVSSR